MNYPEIFIIIGSAIAIIGFNYGIMHNLKSDVDNRLDKLDTRIDKLDNKIDGWTKHLTAMQGEQSKRTDKLYEMFNALLTEIHRIRK
jgi:uncharacterized protein YoxC